MVLTDEANRLLREARNMDGSRRFYPPGLHPATFRYREHWQQLFLLPESPERDEAMEHIERRLAEFEKGEDEAKRQYLRITLREREGSWGDPYEKTMLGDV